MRARATCAAWALALVACPTPPRDPRPEAPLIERFDASSVRLRAPDTQATVRWRVVGADEVLLLGLGEAAQAVAAEGERAIEVTDTVVVTLLARSGALESRAELRLVRDDPDGVRIVAFDAQPARVRVGDPVTIRWDAPGSRGVFVRVVGERALVADGLPQGEITYTPVADATIELRADGPGGPLSAAREVIVERGAPLVDGFVVRPVVLVEGDTVSISWGTRGEVTACTVVRRTDASAESDVVPGGSGSVSWSPPAGRHHIELSCVGPGGRVDTAQAIVVAPAPLAEVVIEGIDPVVTGVGGTVALRFRARGTARVEVRTALASAVVEAARGQALLVAEPVTFAATIAPLDAPGNVATATITVDPARPIMVQASAEARPQGVRVSWSISQADVLRIYAQGTAALLGEVDVRAGEALVAVEVDEAWLRLEAEGPAGTTARVVPISGR